MGRIIKIAPPPMNPLVRRPCPEHICLTCLSKYLCARERMLKEANFQKILIWCLSYLQTIEQNYCPIISFYRDSNFAQFLDLMKCFNINCLLIFSGLFQFHP